MTDLTLILIRGLPGSGKSTLAKKLITDSSHKLIHLEADMFFIDDEGVYLFQPSMLKQAHDWCQKQCRELLKAGQSVVVSNTFVKQWEMKVYRDLAELYNATLKIKTCTGQYENIHDVPVLTIKNMKKNWQS